MKHLLHTANEYLLSSAFVAFLRTILASIGKWFTEDTKPSLPHFFELPKAEAPLRSQARVQGYFAKFLRLFLVQQWPSSRSLLAGLFVLISIVAYAQTTSSISKFVTPPFISGCNNDTIKIQLINIYGGKGVVYSGPVKYSVTVPGPGTIKYVGGTVSSVPAGATSSSPTGNTVDITVPMPALGQTTTIKFVVNADCNVLKLNPLPVFTAIATYPTPYPITGETFNSAVLAVGNAQLNVTGREVNENVPFNTSQWSGINITNSGYGNIDNVKITIVRPTVLTHDQAVSTNAAGAWYTPNGNILPTTTTVTGSNTTYVYSLNGVNLGTDGLLTPGELISFFDRFTTPDYCSIFDSNYKVEYTCAGGGTVCDKPQTITDRTTVAAGTPRLVGSNVQIEFPDGCPKKKGSYDVTNTATGNGAPEGNAYDVDLIVSMGGGLAKFTNIKLNGVTVPLACLSTTAPATAVTIKLKDKMTTDPDGAGGISDLDGDGFFDDMAVGAETTVSFEYSIPCDLACGAKLFYELASNTTFTDFCRTLKGATNTPLDKFGFQQVQAIEQTEKVDYGFFDATTAPVTKAAKFNFQYKTLNMDMSAATAKLVINYSKNMEVTGSSIKINGVAPTNAPVLVGTGATFGGTAGATDKDSAWVVNLTPVEAAMLTDNTPDNLSYDQTRYSCGIDRQNTKNGDNWQLIYQTKSGLCADGSTPCAFDLSCKKAFAYTFNESCGNVPCYVVGSKIERIAPTGFTSVAEATPASPIDSNRSYAGDVVRVTASAFITSNDYQEPIGYWVNQGRPGRDLLTRFSVLYTKPANWAGSNGIWQLRPGLLSGGAVTGSKICVRQRTPDPSNGSNTGTIGSVIFEAPVLVEDFFGQGGFFFGSNGSYASTQSGYNTNLVGYNSDWDCQFNGIVTKDICPTATTENANANNIGYERVWSADGTKARDIYALSIAKALSRAGFVGSAGDASLYFEVKTEWKMDEAFPWDNSSSWSVFGYVEHYGDGAWDKTTTLNMTRNGSCGTYESPHLTVAKEIIVDKPKAVYSSACGLKVCNTLFFKSQEGNYFQNGEVRVPFKLDSIVVDIPTEYSIVGGTTNMVYQSCTGQNLGTITPSASTNHVKFTNAAGGAFPYTDDCAGNKVAYKLCYTLQKTGTASPTSYKMPTKFYLRDEFGKVIIVLDTPSVAEADPILTLTPVASSVTIADGTTSAGKKCTTFYTDYKVTNNTLYDAPNVYLAAKGNANVTICNIQDVNPATPLAASDTSRYATTNMFGKIGTVKAGDTRIIRVFATTTVCSGKVEVCADFGCAYPAGNEPDVSAGNTNLVKASTTFQAEEPAMQTKPVSDLKVTDLCGTKTVEFEILNTKNPNLFALLSTIDMPAGVDFVAGSLQVAQGFTDGSLLSFYAVPAADISNPSTGKYIIDFKNTTPFKTTECGLPGSDERQANRIRVKFDVSFSACPVGGIAQILIESNAKNFCGLTTNSKSAAVLDFVGSATPQNNFDLSHTDKPIKVCSPAAGVPVVVKDTVYIKNLGGYGALSGVTAGRDTMFLSFPYDQTTMTMSNFVVGNAANFGSYPVGTDLAGAPQLKVRIPAGVAVGDSIAVPVTYTITPKVDRLCASPTALLCLYAEFKSNFALDCPAKNLTCSATKTSVSKGLTPRTFLCCYGSIGDYVWSDVNNDGQQGTAAAEAPIAGAKVYLYEETAPGVYTKIDSTVTDATGKYLFDSLFTDNYKVQFVAPAGTILTTPTTGATATDSDAGVNGLSAVVPIDGSLPLGDVGRDNMTIDAGVTPYGSISNYVWSDTNGDGLQTAGEPPVAGVVVKLLDAAGNVIKTTLTDATGQYKFDTLLTGDYKVQFVAPAGKTLVAPTQGTDPTIDSNAGLGGITAPITIDASKPATDVLRNNTTIDAGICVPPVVTDASICQFQKADLQDATGLQKWTAWTGNPTPATIDPITGITSTLTGTGPYYFILSTPAGCADTAKVTIKVAPNMSAVADQTVCLGQPLGRITSVDANAAAGANTFQWYNNNGPQNATTTMIAGQTSDILTVLPTAVGEYRYNLEVTKTATGCKDTVAVKVFIIAYPKLSPLTNQSICEGKTFAPVSTTDANASASGTTTYQWYNNAGTANPGTAAILGQTTNALTVLPTAPGIYKYKVVAGKFGILCKDSVTVTLEIKANPTPTVNSPIICLNSSATLTVANCLGTVTWNDGKTGATRTETPTAAGVTSYTATCTDSFGCIGTAVSTLTVKPNPILTPLTDQKICLGAIWQEVKVVDVTGTTGGTTTYQWYNNLGPANPTTTPLVTETLSTLTLLPTGIGVHKFAVIGTKNGCADTSTVQLTVLDCSKLGTIGDYVWLDGNGDGQQGVTSTDPPIGGAQVYLYEKDPITGNFVKIDSTITSASGQYMFDSLANGIYKVQFIEPSGYNGFTKTNVGTDPTKDSNAGTDGFSHPITIDTDKPVSDTLRNNPTIDAGLIRYGSIGDYVFNDLNANGIQDGTDTPLAGVTVKLLDAAGNVLQTTTTDAAGKYLFDSLFTGTYKVQFVTPSGFDGTTKPNVGDDTKDSDVGTSGITGPITIDVSKAATDTLRNNPNIDAGFVKYGSIGDYVWVDANKDGIQDATEAPVAGVKVYLLNGAGAKIDSTVTDATGKYLFDSLLTGAYQVQFVKPVNSIITAANLGGDDTKDSDVNTATGKSQIINIDTSKPVSDTLRNNPNIDMGIIPTGTIGDYVFYDLNADGKQDINELGVPDVKVYLLDAITGAKLDSTNTDIDGKYSFTVTNGDYVVQVVPPTGSSITIPTQGSDPTKDSNVDKVTGKSATISMNPVLNPAPDDLASNNPTIDAGLIPKQPTGSIGDYVWLDANKDGIQDATESPVAGVKVYLYTKDPLSGVYSKTDSTVTDAAGKYVFGNLPTGVYQVEFMKPVGFEFTTSNVGNDTKDSDVNSLGKSQPILIDVTKLATDTLRNNPNIDAGLVPAVGSIGDYVWLDANKDGIQDASEAGVVGVKVYLLNASGVKIDSTVTDATGKYMFNNLPSGTYQVQVVKPSGSAFTKSNTGSDLTDSDVNNLGKSQLITIDTTKPASDTLRNNPNIDAGIVPTGTIGDYVFYDLNADGQQNGNELGVPGVKVYLLDASTGAKLDSTVTDASGKYTFTVTKGDYVVQFVAPAGSTLTTPNVGNDATDSDAGLNGKTGTITMNPVLNPAPGDLATNNPTIDAGLIPSNCTKPIVTVGNPVCNGTTYTVSYYSSTGNIVSSAGTAANGMVTGIPVGTPVTITATEGLTCSTSLTVQSPSNCTTPSPCTLPSLTVGQPLCAGTTYSVSFTSTGGVVSSSAGAISGNTISGIPVGTNIVVTSTATGDTCKVKINVTSPTNCDKPCENPNITVSGPVCSADLQTYAVNYTLSNGATLIASAGTVSNGSVTGIPAGTTVTLTVKTAGCPDKVITIAAPDCSVKGSIGDYVFLDNDGSNTQTAGDSPVSGVKVYLLNAAGNKIDSTLTDATGKYLFSNLPLGTYSVQFVAPSGTTFVTPLTGGDPSKDSDAGVGGKSAPVTLTATTPNVMTVDAGLKAVICEKPVLTVGNPVCNGTTYSISYYSSTATITASAGTVGNGTVTGIPVGTNVTLTATQSAGCASSLTVQSPSNCTTPSPCKLPSLTVGQPLCAGTTYSVSFTSTGGVVSSSAGAISGNTISGIPVGTNIVVTSTATGDTCKVKINVTSPTNCDKPCENPNITVSGTVCSADLQTYAVNYTLSNGATLIASAGTVSNGSVTGIPAGTTVTLTVKTAGCPDKVISIAAPDCSVKGSIGDYVFLDNDGSNTQTAGDSPVSGVKVYLLDATGNKIDSTLTDATGKYLFSNLPLGTYSVQFVAPSGTTFVTPLTGGDPSKDSDAGVGGKSAPVTLTATTPNVMTVDAGLKAVICEKPVLTVGNPVCNGTTYSISYTSSTATITASAGTVGNGTVTGIPVGTNVTLTATQSAGCASSLTVQSPSNCTTPSPCTLPSLTVGQPLCAGTTYSVSFTSTGGVVSSSAGAISGNTISGIPVGTNIVVTATATGDTCKVKINVTSPTNCDKPCENPNITVSGTVCSADLKTYSVNYTLSNGATVTASAGTVANGSVTGIPAGTAVTLTVKSAGCPDKVVSVPAPDCAPKGSIGDYVWLDNGDNVQGAGDTPVAGVKVYLLDAIGKKIDSTLTDATGKYLFSNLPLSTYSVQFVAPAGQTFVTPLIGGDPAKDSDAGVGGKSAPVTLTATTPDVLTVDAGLKPVAPVGSIGDYVFLDNDGSNTQTAGDSPVAGVKVYLLDATGKKIDSTLTDATGKYLFSNLPLGTYSVQFVAPAGQTFVTPLTGGDPAKDSDAGVGGKSAPVTLTATTPDVTTVDAGLKPVACEKPVLTVGNVVCSGTTYSISYTSSTATITASAGTVGNGIVTGIPVGTNVTLTATQSAGCASSLTVQSPANCTTPSPCKLPTLTVGQPLCAGTTYSVSFSSTGGVVSSSAGAISGNTISGIPVGTNIVVTATATGDTCKVKINVSSPVNCDKPCENPNITVSGPVCSADLKTYSVNYTLSNGATVTASAGTVANGSVTGIPAGTAVTLTVKSAGCPDKIVTVQAPNCGAPCTKPVLTAGTVECSTTSYSIVFYSSTTNVVASIGTIVGNKVTGIPLGTNVTLTATEGTTCMNTITVTGPTTCPSTCTLPNLSLGQALCNGTTYTVSFTTDKGTVVASAGTISGNSIINIPIGTDIVVTATDGACISKATTKSPVDCTTPCVNPNITLSGPICAGNGTYSLNYVLSTDATITTSAGKVGSNSITAIPSGTSVTLTIQKAGCPDKVLVVQGLTCSTNCIQEPPISAIGPNVQACKGKPYPTLKALIVGTGTVDWYKTLTGGTAIATGTLDFTPVGNVVANDTFYLAARSTLPASNNCPTNLPRTRVIIMSIDCKDTVDLHLTKKVNMKAVKLGDVVTYTIKVWNESNKNATGVEVTDQLPAGVQYISSVASRGNYVSSTGIWTIGNMAALSGTPVKGDTVTLTINAKVIAEGVTFNTAELSKVEQIDKDSTPGNGVDGEDDLDRVCITTPFKLCAGQGVDVSVPSNYTGVVWKDAQGNIIPSNNGKATLTKAGTYSFTATNGTCPTGGCCPVIVEEVNCCPAQICIPFTITKKRI